MRVSNLYGVALKETPAEADTIGHQLLLRAGFVRQLGAGIYTALPLGTRTLQRIEAVLREEMDAIGGQEITMPVVHPAEIWQASGRWDQVGPELVRFVDRREAALALAMTHEEVVAWHARTEVKSYRQLPMLVYQIQTKFRDEPRARGGLIRVREFVMKDSYSLDRDPEGLQSQYQAHYDAYFRIFARCGLPVIAVASDTGMMGGKVAHEYMYVSPVGEDHLVLCGGCGYAANREVADFRVPVEPQAPLPVERIETPGTKTIDALARFLDVEPSATAKVVLLTATFDDERPEALVMVVVRGDMEVNEIAVGRIVGASSLRPAQPEPITAAGIVPGYASAIGVDRERVTVVVDQVVADSPNLVAGANEPDHHLRNTTCGRDYEPDHVGVVALAPEGAACARCGAELRLARGVEVGNIFQLGTRYTDAAEASYLDESGRAQPIVMGSYGIGVGRLLACVAEHHHDERGLIWPVSLAPFQVCLVSLARTPQALEIVEDLYTELRAAQISVLLDDRRKVSAGAKLAEADLRGMPLRVVVSARNLEQGVIELARRSGGEPRQVALAEATAAIGAELDALRAEHAAGLTSLPRWADRQDATPAE